ncbi:MAG: heavy metal translocating P-type ATPase [Clostridia bacterium]|nr:heavy metal translocating P-type ATPase [Clostridia bacterium]
MTKILLNVEGMHCAACSASVERAVNKTEGVDSCSVNLTGANALVSFDETVVTIDEIIRSVSNAGFTASIHENKTKSEKKNQAEADEKYAKARLIFSVIFAIPLFYISMGHMFGAPLPSIISPDKFPINFSLIQMILAVMIMISGWDIFHNAFKAGVHKNVNMDTLVSMGSLASFAYSIYSLTMVFKGHSEYIHQLYFESSGLILTFILIGRYLESLSKKKTNSAVEKLMDLSPDTALLIINGTEKEVATESLRIGDIIAVKSGMTVPVDGIIISGNCVIDESMLTGESLPVEKHEESPVYGGTIIHNGYITVKVTAEILESAPAKIAEYVSLAQSTKAPIANLANKIASVFVPVVISIALISSLLWIISGESISFAIKTFVCVLVIACPCSLGLATPTALTVSLGKSASDGVLIKNGEAMERLSHADTVLFDKTGTITNGKLRINEFYCPNDSETRKILSYLGSAESRSEHPLSKAIVEYCKENNFDYIDVSDYEFISGMGIKCSILADNVICGNKKLMASHDVDISGYEDFYNKSASGGKTVLYMAINGIPAAVFSLSDTVRKESIDVISALNRMGYETAMLTGDNNSVALEIASKCGINTVYSELMPADKLEIINKLRKEGKTVVMVGDGINDAPSLTAADVGIAIGTGTDIAIESADAVLIKSNISGVLSAVKIGKRTFKIIKQNLFWAFAYNVICIPIAAGILHIFGGPLLSPMIAAAAMSLSSITVVTNSLRLRKSH